MVLGVLWAQPFLGRLDACHAAALRTRGPVTLAELSCSFSSHLAKVQDNQLLPGLRHSA